LSRLTFKTTICEHPNKKQITTAFSLFSGSYFECRWQQKLSHVFLSLRVRKERCPSAKRIGAIFFIVGFWGPHPSFFRDFPSAKNAFAGDPGIRNQLEVGQKGDARKALPAYA